MKGRIILSIMVGLGMLLASFPIVPTASAQNAVSQPLTAQQIDTLIQENGPIVRFHPGEAYFMDYPGYILDNGATLTWGLVYNETNYTSFNIQEQNSKETTSHTLIADVNYLLKSVKPYPPYNDSADFHYWLTIPDALKSGDSIIARPKAMVRALPFSPEVTELQFWFFYPFSGPGGFRICASGAVCLAITQFDQFDRRYGNWEYVILRFENSTSNLVSAFYSQRGGGQWLAPNELTYSGKHPIVYAAKYSHANYPSTGTKWYQRIWSYEYCFIFDCATASVDLYDFVEAGLIFETFQPDNYEVVNYFTFPVPDWLRYEGPWGQWIKNSNALTVELLWGLTHIDIPMLQVLGAQTGPATQAIWQSSEQDFLWNFTFLPITRKNQ